MPRGRDRMGIATLPTFATLVSAETFTAGVLSKRGPEALAASPDAVLDLAFAGQPCEMIGSDGLVTPLPVARWAVADVADQRLFLDKCVGPTLDVGCGPGRLAGALAAKAVPTTGIDVSAEAVRQTRERGAEAIHGDVFESPFGAGIRRWQHVLLADGNIGIGGDPCRLLSRIRDFLDPEGDILVELASAGVGLVRQQVRLRVGSVVSVPFGWANVGVDAIEAIAASVGLTLTYVHELDGRHVAALTTLQLGDPQGAKR